MREAGAFPSVVLARVQPVAGHTYEVTLSYSPALGAFSYRIFDLTNDRLLQSGGYSVPGYDEPLYAVAGEATPQYLPVATTWQMGMEADRAFLALQHFDTREDAAAVRVQVPVAAPGEYRLYRVADGADVLVASFAPEAGEHRFPIDLSEFPYGSSTLRLDYVLDGETLLSELRKIVVGRVNFSLQPLAPDRKPGRGKPVHDPDRGARRRGSAGRRPRYLVRAGVDSETGFVKCRTCKAWRPRTSCWICRRAAPRCRCRFRCPITTPTGSSC